PVRKLPLIGRHQRRGDDAGGVVAESFERSKVMPHVFDDRSAKEATGPLLAERRLSRLLRLRERILGIQRIIAIEREHTAFQLVRAGPADDADDRAGGLTEFGGELIGVDHVLADRFQRKTAPRTGDALFVVAGAIDDDAVVATQLAAGIDAAATDTRDAGR